MKESKDIVLKKGDRVYCKDVLSGNEVICIITSDEAYTNNFFSDITKVERPTQYKTIYEASKQILDKEEKEYLEAVIRPFRDRVECIEKKVYARDFEYIHIRLYGDDSTLPAFEENKMYKGMELNKEYTLKELGLFKE